MLQQFVELGQGYGDVYELCELIETNQHRFHNAFIFISEKNESKVASLAVCFNPVGDGNFMPIYICREGIPYSEEKPSKRIQLFEDALSKIGKTAVPLELKHSSLYNEVILYYQHIIGVLRMNRLIPPKQ